MFLEPVFNFLSKFRGFITIHWKKTKSGILRVLAYFPVDMGDNAWQELVLHSDDYFGRSEVFFV